MDMDDSTTAEVDAAQATHRWPRRLVWVAAALPLMGIVWTSVHHPAFALAMCALLPVPALPNLARRRRPFAVACAVTGCLLIFAGGVGIELGFAAYLPAGAILLLAPFADPPRRHGVGHAVIVAGLIAVLLTTIGWSRAIYDSALRSPHLIEASTTAAFWQRPDVNQLIEGTGRGVGYGATGVSSGDGVLYVSYGDRLTDREVQLLRQHLLSLSGVSSVIVCQAPWRGNTCRS